MRFRHLKMILINIGVTVLLTGCSIATTTFANSNVYDDTTCYVQETHVHPGDIEDQLDDYNIEYFAASFMKSYKNSPVKNIILTDRTIPIDDIWAATESSEAAADFLLKFDKYQAGNKYGICSKKSAKEDILDKLQTGTTVEYTRVTAYYGIYEINLMRRYSTDNLKNGIIQSAWNPEDITVYITGQDTKLNLNDPENFSITLNDDTLIHLSEIRNKIDKPFIHNYTLYICNRKMGDA